MLQPPSAAPPPAQAVDHYENFPVASWLCPAALRPAVAAIYWYARTADDIADEGTASAAQRLADLAAYREDLMAVYAGQAVSARWPAVFGPLQHAVQAFQLPQPPLADLLSAFAQDVRKTDEASGYADRAALLDYCSRSAAPVGRLMLHLYGVDDPVSIARSDAICMALQLINFWQDLSVDLPRGRHYLPLDRCAHFGVDPRSLAAQAAGGPARALVTEQADWARAMMVGGAPLVHRLAGRAGWELRFVVQGGLRILDKLAAMDHASWRARPRVRPWDMPLLVWRSLWMRECNNPPT